MTVEEDGPVVSAMEPILTRVMSTKTFGYLPSAQREAVIRALLLTLVDARGTTDSERQGLRSRLLDLPWAWELCEYSADGVVDRSREMMTRVEHPVILERIARSIARDVKTSSLREGVFLMMVLLFHADGGTERERAVLTPVRTALGIAPTREAWIIDQIEKDLTDQPR